ncbi:Panacea domain-containing protein [Flavobacterium johnsoniae]|uniref:Panacea domain-containing protein n=1 Tax=Flavobacterium johnsoniae TaxID=986 RepID=UPI0011EF423D|nr:type II toxin-antitoxin system antitoxin SocA domain-containing protein [Flavobacterium johnsoniae]
MAYNVVDIANKIIANINTEAGDLISNLKLQKLLYYMQGYYIAIFNKKLFDDVIEAWQYGPVVPTMYMHFKEFGSSAITISDEIKENIIRLDTDEEENLFNDVFEQYNQYSAIALMNMTHDEKPWRQIFNANPKGEIDFDLLKDFFLTQVEDD